MKNVTVTMNYADFEELKKKADKYAAVHKHYQNELEKQAEFSISICESIEKANDCTTLEHKQYYIAQGIKTICSFYETDMTSEYGELDEGQAPAK